MILSLKNLSYNSEYSTKLPLLWIFTRSQSLMLYVFANVWYGIIFWVINCCLFPMIFSLTHTPFGPSLFHQILSLSNVNSKTFVSSEAGDEVVSTWHWWGHHLCVIVDREAREEACWMRLTRQPYPERGSWLLSASWLSWKTLISEYYPEFFQQIFFFDLPNVSWFMLFAIRITLIKTKWHQDGGHKPLPWLNPSLCLSCLSLCDWRKTPNLTDLFSL